MKFLLADEKATGELARTLAQAVLESPRQKHAQVITLSGELGAGKTTFAQAFGRACGVKKRLLSPTFALRSLYKTTAKQYPTLEHYDWYRLEGAGELAPIGWKEALGDAKRILLVEWPERAKRALPKDVITVKLAHNKDGSRKADIQFHGK